MLRHSKSSKVMGGEKYSSDKKKLGDINGAWTLRGKIDKIKRKCAKQMIVGFIFLKSHLKPEMLSL